MEKYTRKMFLNDMLALDLTPEQRECAERWLIALDKRAASAAPRVNEVRAANERLAALVVEKMRRADEPINAKWLSEHVAGITSPSKAVAVVRVAAEMGLVERYEEKGKAYYRLI